MVRLAAMTLMYSSTLSSYNLVVIDITWPAGAPKVGHGFQIAFP